MSNDDAVRKPPILEQLMPVILVADDDFFMRAQAKVALKDVANIIEAESGKQAVELYKQYRPTILILDIHMPDRDGKATLKEILEYDANAYVIMISADAQLSNVEETVYAGAKGFIVKPFTKASILKYVLACAALQKNPD